MLSHIRCYHRSIRRTIKVQRRLIRLYFIEHPAQCNRNGKQFSTHGNSKNRGMGTEHLPAEKNPQLPSKEQNTSCTEKLSWNLSSLVQQPVWMVGRNLSQKSSLPISFVLLGEILFLTHFMHPKNYLFHRVRMLSWLTYFK